MIAAKLSGTTVVDTIVIGTGPVPDGWVTCPAWVGIGMDINTPEPPPAVEVPQSVTMRQARLALLGAELLDDVDAAIAAIPDATQRRAAQIEWEYAQTVDRTSAFTLQLAAGLGLTNTQLDDLFTQAAAL